MSEMMGCYFKRITLIIENQFWGGHVVEAFAIIQVRDDGSLDQVCSS